MSYRATASALFDVAKKEDISEEQLEVQAREYNENLKERVDETTIESNVYPLNVIDSIKRGLAKIADAFLGEPESPKIYEYDEVEREKERLRLEESKIRFKKPDDFIEPTEIEEAEDYAKELFDLTSIDYTKVPSVEMANKLNESLRILFERYGDVGTIKRIEFVDNLGNDVAQYEPVSLTLRIMNYSSERFQEIIDRENKRGHWNARTFKDLIAHEFGHAIDEYIRKNDPNYQMRLDAVYKLGINYGKRGIIKLSRYAKSSPNEFLAEVFSYLAASPNDENYLSLLQLYFEDDIENL